MATTSKSLASAAESSTGENLIWYFAIGSMMNPLSMKHRDVVPLYSVGGEISDHKMYFFSKAGVAEALVAPGETFHGVLHRLDEETMDRLDQYEMGYTRTEARARRYDTDEMVSCHVYTRPDPAIERNPDVDSPPQQRYKEILVAGAEHFQLDPSYVLLLKNLPFQPRPLPNEFQSLPDVPRDAPTTSLEDLKQMNGQDGSPLCITINGKVLECIVEDQVRISRLQRMVQARGSVWDLVYAKAFYDMKYGVPERLEDFTREHGAYLEHLFVSFYRGSVELSWKVVGRFDRTWKD